MLLVLLVHDVVSVVHCAPKYLPKPIPPVLLLIFHVAFHIVPLRYWLLLL